MATLIDPEKRATVEPFSFLESQSSGHGLPERILFQNLEDTNEVRQ